MVTAENTSVVKLHEFCAEASELGLPPGTWPKELPTTLGNGQQFIFQCLDARGSAMYVQAYGCISLVVFND